MKFSKIFNEVIKHWPEEIDISDGEILPNNGARFPHVWGKYEEVDSKLDVNADWHTLMNGVFMGFYGESLKSFFLRKSLQ